MVTRDHDTAAEVSPWVMQYPEQTMQHDVDRARTRLDRHNIRLASNPDTREERTIENNEDSLIRTDSRHSFAVRHD